MFIKKIYNNPFTRPNGEQANRRVIVDAEGKRLTVFPESWNPAWQEGMEVEINNDWIVEGEFNGKTTYTFEVPPEFRLPVAAPVMNTPTKPPQAPTNGLAEVKAEIAKLNTTMAMVLGKLESISHQIARPPVQEEEVTQEEIDALMSM